MKRIFIGGLSVLLMSAATAPAVIAQTRTNPSMQTDSSMMYDVRKTEAFNLVSSAYRGEFEEQGIPSYAQLSNEYEAGIISAEDVVKAAIKAGELSPRALEDEDYLNAVQLQLNALAGFS